MRLSDIKEGIVIVLQVSLQGQKQEFPIRVLNHKGDSMYTEPVRVDGKLLGFENSNAMLSVVYYREDDLPVVWQAVSCNLVKVKNDTQYKIIASGEGYELNRRGAFRLFIGVEAVAQLGINKKALDIIVKDVSETGFSFVSEVDMEVKLPQPVRLVFKDLNQSFNLIGLVVRKVKIEEKKILYGCRLTSNNYQLNRYIREKQRQQMVIKAAGNSVYEEKKKLEASLKEVPKISLAAYSDAEGRKSLDDVVIEERRAMFEGKHKSKGKKV